MDKELQVLILEDSPDDAELAQRELRKAGIVFTSRRVDSRAAFVAALAPPRPDIILADYKLPGFDGMAALNIAQAIAPEVPFIFLSGALGEEFAIETLHQGAADYVLKGHLSKLVPAVNRALLGAAERRRREEAEARLRIYSERLKLATEAAAIGVWEIDPEKREAVWDDRMFEMFGLPRIEPMTYARWRDTIYPEDLPEAEAALSKAFAGERVRNFVFRIVRPSDGLVRHIQGDAVGSRDANGKVVKVVGIDFDITERKHMEEELRALATTDALTGLPNRRFFLARLDEQLARVQRLVTQRAMVLMLDLDHFKRVNDIYGHAAGDAVLRHFAALLRDDLRKIDTVGRMGGEEFAIVLPGADATAAQAFAERLCRKVAASPLVLDCRPIPVTVSIGIAAMNATDASTDAALMRADAALYRAKATGRNRAIIADAPDLPD